MQTSEEKCDPTVYEIGTVVFLTNTIRTKRMEPWIRNVRARSGQPVDWHWIGGRAVVKAMGDLDKVREAIIALRAEHDEGYAEACRDLDALGWDTDDIKRHCDGIWSYNAETYGVSQ